MLLNNNVNSVQNNIDPAAQPSKSNQLTQDDFIKLLLTQMRLQTPENPFDSNTMMQQMSQLTTLSATNEMQNTVKSLNANLGTSQVLEAAQLVGKKVQILSGVSPLTAGEGLKGSLVLPTDVESTTVTIKDSNDKVIKVIELGASSSGVLDFSWDGLDTDGKAMPPGIYKISGAASFNGESAPVPTTGTFNVNSVALDRNGKGVILNLDGVGGVKMDDVIKIL